MSSVAGRRPMGVGRSGRDATVVLTVGGAEVGRFPLTGSARPDLAVIDRLARLALGARHLGGGIALRDAGAELLALIDFVGLGDLLLPAGD